MKALRAGIAVLILTGGGFVVGGAAVYTWDRTLWPADPQPQQCWEATVYLPLANNAGRRFSEEEFQAALALLVQGTGGVSIGFALTSADVTRIPQRGRRSA